LCGLLEEGAHEKSPECLDGNLGDFGGILGGFCKGLGLFMADFSVNRHYALYICGFSVCLFYQTATYPPFGQFQMVLHELEPEII